MSDSVESHLIENIRVGDGCTIFFNEIKFILDENKVLSRVERHVFAERLIKKYKKGYFDDFFNKKIIETMTSNNDI